MPLIAGKSNTNSIAVFFRTTFFPQFLFSLLLLLLLRYPNLKILEREIKRIKRREIFDREDDGDNFNRDGYLFYFFFFFSFLTSSAR